MNLVQRAIKSSDYRNLLSLDNGLYPADHPITPKILDEWYKENPEFGMIYELDGVASAFFSVVPLSGAAFREFLSGVFSEHELTGSRVFRNTRDKEIGLHIYQIRKMGNHLNGFFRTGLGDLSKVIEKLREQNLDLKVAGFSGFCITPEGVNLFKKRLKCKEEPPLSTEYIAEKDGKREIVELESDEAVERKKQEGYKLHRCQLLVSFPGEESPVWDYIKA